MKDHKTFADEILERCGMIVCNKCMNWMWESESEPFRHDNGICVRDGYVHKNGCPVKQQISNIESTQFGDD